MDKLTIEDLLRIKDQNKAELTLRKGGHRAKVTIHMGTCGIVAGARNVMRALIHEISYTGADDIIVTTSGCAGLCAHEPMVTIEIANQPPVKYGHLNEEKIKEIFKEHIMGENPVEQYALSLERETDKSEV